MNLLHVGILGYRHTCLHPAQDTDTCYGTALLHLLCISQIRVKVIGVVGVLQRKAFGSSRLDFFGCLPNSLRSVFILFISLAQPEEQNFFQMLLINTTTQAAMQIFV